MTHFFLVMALARVLAGETPGCPVEAKVAAAHVWHNRTEAGIAGGWFGDAEPTALDWHVALNWMNHEDPTDGSLWFIHPDDRERMAWLQGPAAVRTGHWQCKGTEVESWKRQP